MSRARLLAGVGAVLVLSVGSAHAQGPPATPIQPGSTSIASSSPPAPMPVAERPFTGSGRLGQSQVITSRMEVSPAAVMQQQRRRAPGVILMIVGAAGVVLGIVTDEGIITVAGAGVGLYGLYLYLR